MWNNLDFSFGFVGHCEFVSFLIPFFFFFFVVIAFLFKYKKEVWWCRVPPVVIPPARRHGPMGAPLSVSPAFPSAGACPWTHGHSSLQRGFNLNFYQHGSDLSMIFVWMLALFCIFSFWIALSTCLMILLVSKDLLAVLCHLYVYFGWCETHKQWLFLVIGPSAE